MSRNIQRYLEKCSTMCQEIFNNILRNIQLYVIEYQTIHIEKYSKICCKKIFKDISRNIQTEKIFMLIRMTTIHDDDADDDNDDDDNDDEDDDDVRYILVAAAAVLP